MPCTPGDNQVSKHPWREKVCLLLSATEKLAPEDSPTILSWCIDHNTQNSNTSQPSTNHHKDERTRTAFSPNTWSLQYGTGASQRVAFRLTLRLKIELKTATFRRHSSYFAKSAYELQASENCEEATKHRCWCFPQRVHQKWPFVLVLNNPKCSSLVSFSDSSTLCTKGGTTQRYCCLDFLVVSGCAKWGTTS